MEDEYVILVDANDKPGGKWKKWRLIGKVYCTGLFLFSFSIKGELDVAAAGIFKISFTGIMDQYLLQSSEDDERIDVAAAHRRMKEEMGFDCELNEVFSFTYKADVGMGLTEHEFDHVFIGKYDEAPVINPKEAANWKFEDLSIVKNDIQLNPDNYTVWFKIAFTEVEGFLKNQ